MPINLSISPLQHIPEHPGNRQGISLFIKRDDLLHPEIQGSKGRKLAALLPQIKQAHPAGLVTFGGAFSNHLHAVAVAGRIVDLPTVGILRGEHADLQNPTLRFCQENGMRLHRMPKTQYDACKNQDSPLLNSLFPHCFLLPEGGNMQEAITACAAISREIAEQLPTTAAGQKHYLCTPAGTGCTAAGMIAGLTGSDSQVLVFPVSSHGFDQETILQLLPDRATMEQRFSIVHEYSFGGFAKHHPPTMEFVRSFFTQTNILLDPIYTAKMLFGVFDMLAKGQFESGSTVVALHTGGLQGWDGFAARYGIDTTFLF